jgi:CBS-domain-containing membrane protein
MTANDTNRVGSDNSDSRTAEDAEIISEHDVRDRRIVEETRAVGGTTTRRDLLSRTELTLDELENRLRELADRGYVDLIGESERELVVLTCRGEQVAGGYR